MLCWADVLFFPSALHLTKSWIAKKSTVVWQNVRVAELEEANAQLWAELNAAQSRFAEVEHREHALISDYEGLHRDFDDLRTSCDAIVKEKPDLEKMEREKVQWFWNSLCKKLAKLWVDIMVIVAALGGDAWILPLPTLILPIFWSGFGWRSNLYPPPLPNAMRISLVMLWLVFSRFLRGWSVSILPELKKLVLSCSDSLLHDVPDDVGRIAIKLVKNWRVKHGLPYCIQKIEEENRVSFVAIILDLWKFIIV
jgi:hypothetical protein